MKTYLLTVVYFLSCFFLRAESYRILSLLVLAGRSNMNYFDIIHLELAKRGHSITVISPTTSSVKHENIKEKSGLDFSNMVKGMMTGPDFFEMRLNRNRMSSLFLMDKKFASDCDTFHQLASVQEIIQGREEFDLVMTMAFMNECVYGIVHHLNISSVLISTTPVSPWFAAATGSPFIPSFVPNIYWTGSEDMTFFDRVGNIGSYIFQMASRSYVYFPAIEATYKKYIPNAASIEEVKRNMSLVLGAGHSSFGPKRPAMPDLLDDIGGIHCTPAQPLPKEISDMIKDESGNETDFIFFSLGSIVQGGQMQTHAKIRDAFTNTFAKFKNFKILWKWEVDESTQLPPNVKVAKWFPQQDLLGHPKCKLFITHGGLSSLHEAIYHGVPVIGIPFFGDQDWNMKQVEYAKIGRTLQLWEITEELLTQLLEQFLNSSKYANEMKARSRIFRDRQMPASEHAVWWIEYVLRYGGATHLRSPARNLNIIQYYCLDVFAFFFLATFIVMYLLYVVVRKIICRLSKNIKAKHE